MLQRVKNKQDILGGESVGEERYGLWECKAYGNVHTVVLLQEHKKSKMGGETMMVA